MSSRINYQLIGNDKTLISDGSATVLTSTHANQTSLGIKKEFKSDRLHSSSIGVRLTEEKGQRDVASTIDLGLSLRYFTPFHYSSPRIICNSRNEF